MIKIKTVITSIQSNWVTRPTRSNLGAIRARFGPVFGAWRKFCSFEATVRQHKYELICFRTASCFVNILAPKYCTEMVLYSKFAYGSQFSGEKKKQVENPIPGYQDINPKMIFVFLPYRLTKAGIFAKKECFVLFFVNFLIL